MAKFPLNFPVFYSCAIRGRTATKQRDVLQALLTGKYSDECLDEEKIQESTISSYVNGRRQISAQAVNAVNKCEHKEIIRRFQMIKLYNHDDSAENMRRFLEEARPIGETETRRLLDYSQSCETPLDFLAEVFIAALSCPAEELCFLDNAERKRLSKGLFLEEENDETQGREKAGSGEPVPEFLEIAPDYEFRQHRMRTADDKEKVQNFLTEMLKSELGESKNHAPVIREGDEGSDIFWEEFLSSENSFFYEIYGTNAQLQGTLRRLPTLSGGKGAFLFLDSNPDILTQDFYSFKNIVMNRCLPDARVIACLRISGWMDEKSMMYLALIANPAAPVNRRRPQVNAQPDTHKRRPARM